MIDILLTNDDGYKSKGFYPLLHELTQHFSVVAVVPFSEQSWIGKSISRENELSLKNRKLNSIDIHTLNGTPADCVQVGLYDVIKEQPKLVVSGINLGLNTGHGRILSSGTIGASMEASIDGVKSISLSIHIPEDLKASDLNEKIFHNAAKITTKIIKILINNSFEKNVDLISINIPFAANINSKIEITKPHRDPYGKLFHKNIDTFKHSPPPIDFNHTEPGTDLNALANGKISVTPISLELVSAESMKEVDNILKKEW